VSWVNRDGVAQSQQTHTPAAFVGRLSSELGGEPEGLLVTRPSLEDVYLNLVEQSVEQGANT
jgi:ABC-2 type transport system ATP-binding protein